MCHIVSQMSDSRSSKRVVRRVITRDSYDGTWIGRTPKQHFVRTQKQYVTVDTDDQSVVESEVDFVDDPLGQHHNEEEQIRLKKHRERQLEIHERKKQQWHTGGNMEISLYTVSLLGCPGAGGVSSSPPYWFRSMGLTE